LAGFLFGFDTAVINGAVAAIQHQFSASALALGLSVSAALDADHGRGGDPVHVQSVGAGLALPLWDLSF